MVDFKKLMTPFKRHEAKWKHCEACSLCRVRRNVVIARGTVPATILFIGEAPGDSEDVLGRPFAGPAGKLLDNEIMAALQDSKQGHFYDQIALTNLVCCIPKDEQENRKRGEPLPAEIEACSPRLKEFIEINGSKLKLIVAVGALSEKQAKKENWKDSYQVVSIIHPAAILRMDVTQRGLAYQRVVVQLSDAFADLAESLNG